MRTSEFDYYLPINLIAQEPLENRLLSRLLVLDRKSGFFKHDQFYNLFDYLKEGDILVLNNSRVIPARIKGIKLESQAKIEILLLEETKPDCWLALTKPARRVTKGTKITFGDGLLVAECILEAQDGIKEYRFTYTGDFYLLLDKIGQMPTPPYIHQQLNDKGRYQTEYAQVSGSVAAPTAGFHFTYDFLDVLKQKGILIVDTTLHIGLDTFRPVMTENIQDHQMHSEAYNISHETCLILNQAKKEKRRIIAVGTTSTRLLEANYLKYGKFVSESAKTDIFIYPPFQFKAIDGLITNFHLPKSSLLMMVSAFASKKIIIDTYLEAIKESYRFFSFGDSMFIADHKALVK